MVLAQHTAPLWSGELQGFIIHEIMPSESAGPACGRCWGLGPGARLPSASRLSSLVARCLLRPPAAAPADSVAGVAVAGRAGSAAGCRARRLVGCRACAVVRLCSACRTYQRNPKLAKRHECIADPAPAPALDLRLRPTSHAPHATSYKPRLTPSLSWYYIKYQGVR
jgi:hypothetical protein